MSNKLADRRIGVVPSGAALGAEVRGVDLSQPLDGELVDAIRQAWYAHLVLVFRDQVLTDRQLVAFSSYFGEVMVDDRPVDYERRLDTELPDIVDVVSNVVVNGKEIGALGAGEAIWHTDTLPVPNSALLLYALEVPSSGGNTRFANMYAAYETLSPALGQKIDGRVSVHDRRYSLFAGDIDQGSSAAIDEDQQRSPRFPIVRTHGATGRKSLFLGRQGSGHIIGVPVEESRMLLAQLWQHMTRPELVWEHQWRVGDVVMWDNRCTIHSRGTFDPKARRRLHRTTVRGEWPH